MKHYFLHSFGLLIVRPLVIVRSIAEVYIENLW